MPAAASARIGALAAVARALDMHFNFTHAGVISQLSHYLRRDLAAKGVLLRDPLNPDLPGEFQAMMLPCISVILTMRVVKGRADMGDAFGGSSLDLLDSAAFSAAAVCRQRQREHMAAFFASATLFPRGLPAAASGFSSAAFPRVFSRCLLRPFQVVFAAFPWFFCVLLSIL